MSKKELKSKKLTILETISRLETNLALAKSEGNHRAFECALKLKEFFEKQLKSLKEH